VPNTALDVGDYLPGIALEPDPVERLGHEPELDQKAAREVLRLNLAPLLAPQAKKSALVLAHDDPGVRAADELPPIAAVTNSQFSRPHCVLTLIDGTLATIRRQFGM